jgi:acyl carrier protein
VEEKIKKIVQMALEEVNEDADEVIEYGENAALFGKGEGMDSFSFVTLISNIEEQIQEQFGKEVYLVSDQVYEKKYNPFATIGSLEKYIAEQVQEEA